jgi:hypothetical protein
MPQNQHRPSFTRVEPKRITMLFFCKKNLHAWKMTRRFGVSISDDDFRVRVVTDPETRNA